MTNKDKRRSLDVWNTVPWLAAHRIGGHHARIIDSTDEAQHHSAHTWPIEGDPTEQDPTLQGEALDAGAVPAEDRVRSVPPTD